MSKSIKSLLALLVLFFISNVEVFAVGGPSGPPGGCWPPSTCIPIDGGISFLLIAGAAYGAKKVHDISKKEKD